MASDSGTYDESVLARRYAIAQKLLEQGNQPVRSWTQGLANMANSALGGYQIGAIGAERQAEREQGKADLAEGLAAIARGGAPAATAAAPATLPAGPVAAAPDTGGKIYSNDEPSPLDPPSGDDRNRALATILGEAGNQPPQGMQAVASVIRNRAVDGSYGGDTPSGVVTAKNQFEPWNTDAGKAKMAQLLLNPALKAKAETALSAAYGEGGRAPDDPTEGKTMFYAPAAQAALGRPAPAWAQGEGQKIGDHVFYDDNSPTPAGATPTQGALPTAPAASTGAAATTDMKIISRLLNSTNPAAKAIGAKLMDNIVKNDAPTDNVKEFNAENALRAKQGKPALTSLTDFILEKGGKDREVKPMTDEQRRQWKVPEGVAAGMDDKGKPVFSQPSTVNTISPVVSGINDRFDKQLAGAQASHQTIASIHETRKALDGGAITGAFSDPRLKFAKIASLFGANGDAITNTETARAAVGEQVLQSAKTLGANPSNTDRDYIEKVKGGSIELNETSMRKLLDMQERWARDGVKRSNEMAEKLIQTDPEKLGRFKPMLMTDQPPSYEDYVKASPAAGAAAGAPAATTKIRKFNPATGKIE